MDVSVDLGALNLSYLGHRRHLLRHRWQVFRYGCTPNGLPRPHTLPIGTNDGVPIRTGKALHQLDRLEATLIHLYPILTLVLQHDHDMLRTGFPTLLSLLQLHCRTFDVHGDGPGLQPPTGQTIPGRRHEVHRLGLLQDDPSPQWIQRQGFTPSHLCPGHPTP